MRPQAEDFVKAGGKLVVVDFDTEAGRGEWGAASHLIDINGAVDWATQKIDAIYAKH